METEAPPDSLAKSLRRQITYIARPKQPFLGGRRDDADRFYNLTAPGRDSARHTFDKSYAIKLAFAVTHPRRRSRKPTVFKRVLYWVLAAIFGFYALVSAILVLLRWIDPPLTAVQSERRLDALVQRLPYRKRYSFVPLERIAPELQHAVLAAEDARFFHHHGFDWTEIGNAVEEDLEGGRRRGASTITQQLVRNRFLSTGRSALRKRRGVFHRSADGNHSF